MTTTNKALILILLSSILAGTGQILWKMASPDISLNPISLLNIFLILGGISYIVATGLMVLAFREGELSVLHPILAISYVWVAILSSLIFVSETLTIKKIVSILIISIGVSLVGVGGKK